MFDLLVSELPPRPIKLKAEPRSISLTDPVWERLQEIASSEGYKSRNELVRGILEKWVSDYDKKHRRGQG